MKEYYKSALPHIHPKGAIFFVTFRLADSIPKVKLTEWEISFNEILSDLNMISDEHERNLKIFNHRKREFAKYDELLDNMENGPDFLKRVKVMDIVKEQIHRFDGELYTLIAYCIMSNHVHLLIDTNRDINENNSENYLYGENTHLSYIMKRIKGASASYANKVLNRSGRFWQKESYDMYIRNNKMLTNVIWYILNNPVKAGLVKKWEDYAGNYLKAE